MWAGFFLSVFLKYVFSIPVPGFFMLVLIAGAAAVSDRNRLIMLSLGLVPLYTSVQFIFGIGICTLVFVFKYYDKIKLKYTDALLLFLVIWELLHAFSNDFSFVEFAGMLIPYLFLTVAVRSFDGVEHFSAFARTFAGSTLFTCVVIMLQIFSQNGFNADRSWKILLRLGSNTIDGEVSGAYLNPNTLGFFIAISIALLVRLMINRIGTKLDIAASAILLLLGLFTSSRTFLLCILTFGILTVFTVGKDAGSKIRTAIIGIASLAAASLILYLVAPATFDFFVNRIINGDNSSRSILFQKYNDIILTNPRFILWGYGLNGVAEYQMSVIGQVPHNGFQELIFVWGFPGLFAYSAYIVSLTVNAVKANKGTVRLLNWIPFILFAFKIQVGQLITFTPVPLVLLLLYISIACDEQYNNAQYAGDRAEK